MLNSANNSGKISPFLTLIKMPVTKLCHKANCQTGSGSQETMMATNIAAHASERFNAIATEEMILQLFAPVPPHGNKFSSFKTDHGSLWRADAIHRAKNMAQLTGSLASLAEEPSRDWLPREMVAKTRSLARAYAELGTTVGRCNWYLVFRCFRQLLRTFRKYSDRRAKLTFPLTPMASSLSPICGGR